MYLLNKYIKKLSLESSGTPVLYIGWKVRKGKTRFYLEAYIR
jgi:hypothetical protein